MYPSDSPASRSGSPPVGRIRKPYREVRLEALPAAIPAELVIDITDLDHEDSIMASEMKLPEGVRAIYDRDYVVVKVQKPRGRLDEDGEESEASETTE